jgi:hypothetical protein
MSTLLQYLSKLLTLKRTLKGIARYLSEVHCNKQTQCGGVVMGVLKTTWFLIDGRYGPATYANF